MMKSWAYYNSWEYNIKEYNRAIQEGWNYFEVNSCCKDFIEYMSLLGWEVYSDKPPYLRFSRKDRNKW